MGVDPFGTSRLCRRGLVCDMNQGGAISAPPPCGTPRCTVNRGACTAGVCRKQNAGIMRLKTINWSPSAGADYLRLLSRQRQAIDGFVRQLREADVPGPYFRQIDPSTPLINPIRSRLPAQGQMIVRAGEVLVLLVEEAGSVEVAAKSSEIGNQVGGRNEPALRAVRVAGPPDDGLAVRPQDREHARLVREDADEGPDRTEARRVVGVDELIRNVPGPVMSRSRADLVPSCARRAPPSSPRPVRASRGPACRARPRCPQP